MNIVIVGSMILLFLAVLLTVLKKRKRFPHEWITESELRRFGEAMKERGSENG